LLFVRAASKPSFRRNIFLICRHDVQAGMLIRSATSSRMAEHAGMTGVFALAGALLAACASVPAMEMTPELRDAEAVTSRQIAVSVDAAGGVAWEGRAVSREELADLMRDAAMGSPQLLLVVVPASGDVRYGDILSVMQLARMRGIQARIAEPKVNRE
jgi:hypothetical protein